MGTAGRLGVGAVGRPVGGGGLAGLYAYWVSCGARSKPVAMVADYLPEPPSELPPGLAGTLLDESVDMEDILATVVDLARRKAISITEEQTEGFFRTGRDFIYRRENNVALQPYEAELIKAMFGSKDEVRLSDLKEKFYSKLDGIKSKIYAASVEQGLFPNSPQKVRSQYGCLGHGIVAAAAIGLVFFTVFGQLTMAACMPGLGMGVLAVGVLVLARPMPRKTDKGAEEAAKWRAFRNYLDNIEKYSDVEAQKTIWILAGCPTPSPLDWTRSTSRSSSVWMRPRPVHTVAHHVWAVSPLVLRDVRRGQWT